MRELTLQQKNDMIDFMVEICGEWERCGVKDYGLVLAYSKWSGENNVAVICGVIPEIFPEMVNVHFRFQSERIIYLLLIKEFINTGVTSTRTY